MSNEDFILHNVIINSFSFQIVYDVTNFQNDVII